MLSALTRETPLGATITAIREAIRDDRVSSLAGTLAGQYRRGSFNDSDLYPRARNERYARKLLHRDPLGAFVVVGMTWLPGQFAAIHDHAGLWGAEIVTHGTMHETTYFVAQSNGDRAQLIERGASFASAGSVGIISPPFDVHRFGNSGASVAHSIHVYAGEPLTATSFLPADGWHRVQKVRLSYDD